MKKILLIITLLLPITALAQGKDNKRITAAQDFRMMFENPAYENLYGDDYGQDYRRFTLDLQIKYKYLLGNEEYAVFNKPFAWYLQGAYQYAQLLPDYHRLSGTVGMYKFIKIYDRYGNVNLLELYIDVGIGVIARKWIAHAPSLDVGGQVAYMFSDQLGFTVASQYITRTDLSNISFKESIKQQTAVGFVFKFKKL